MMMMATGLLMASSLLSLTRADGYELEIVDSFQPTASNIIGYISIGEEMHFELDVTIHSLPSAWASVFHCGSPKGMWSGMPGIWLHRNSATDGANFEGFRTCWTHDDDSHDGIQTDKLTVGQTYHLEIDITESLYTVTQNGVVQSSKSKADHTTYDSLVCYASDPWYGVADVTISNIRVWAGELYISSAVYHLYQSAKTWSDANTYCSAQGGQLATWGSQSEYDRMVALHDASGSTKATWVGLHDTGSEGKWEMIDGDTSYCDNYDGTDCDNIPQWASGQPNDWRNSQDCASIKTSVGDLLNDASCSINSYWFICEFTECEDMVIGDVYPAPVMPRMPEPSNPVTVPGTFVLDFASGQQGMLFFALAASNIVLLAIVVYYCCTVKRGSAVYGKVVQYSEDENLQI
jgi:hypothetical protein